MTTVVTSIAQPPDIDTTSTDPWNEAADINIAWSRDRGTNTSTRMGFSIKRQQCCRIRSVRYGNIFVECGHLAKREAALRMATGTRASASMRYRHKHVSAAKRSQRLEKSTSAATKQIGSQRLYVLASFFAA